MSGEFRSIVLWIENAFGLVSDDIRSCVLWIEFVFGQVSGKFRSTVLWVEMASVKCRMIFGLVSWGRNISLRSNVE